jgi:hypothetical protein
MTGDKVTVGSVFDTKSFGQCIVTEYVNANKVYVKFINTGGERYTTTGNLKRGLVKDYLTPVVCGVGFIGNGKYPCRVGGKVTKEYSHWSAMLQRVYEPDGVTAYEDVSVAECWRNFQGFAHWCQSQKGFSEGCFNLDKDLLKKGNRVYSPDHCCFIPYHVNTAITGMKCFNTSGETGVYKSKTGMFCAEITMNGSKVHLGSFKTKEQASFAYKNAKESYVQSLAEVYKERVAENVYNAIKNWRVNDNSII